MGHFTIDTNNITDLDRAVLALLSGEAPTLAAAQAATPTEATTPAAVEEEKPKRTRRSPAQKKADDEAAAKAAEAEVQDEPTPDSENAESDGVTMEELTELATQLIRDDREAMVELLKGYGVRRASEVPEDKRGEFADAIRAKLKA